MCRRKSLESLLKAEDIEGSLKLLALISEIDPSFSNPCHDFTHAIGRAAYMLFINKKVFKISEKTAYCSFGFYHGFMETLVAKGGNIAQARQFCQFVEDQLGTKTPNAILACYHGIGHGSVDIHDPKYAGDERALVGPPLVKCAQFAQTEEQLRICATGVFDSLSIAYYNHQNGFVMNDADPLWLCKEQTGSFKEACYRDMEPAILWYSQYDLNKALPLILAHAEKEYWPVAVSTLAEDSVRYVIDGAGVSPYIATCRTLPGGLVYDCIEGLASGTLQFGIAGKEYESSLVFCEYGNLTTTERQHCYKSFLGYAKNRYSNEIVAQICTQVPKSYQSNCLYR